MVTGREDVRKKMDSSHYKQLLMYAPDQEEVEKLKSYNGDMSKLNEVDVLAIKVKLCGRATNQKKSSIVAQVYTCGEMPMEKHWKHYKTTCWSSHKHCFDCYFFPTTQFS